MKKLSFIILILCLSWLATAAQAFTTTTNYSFQKSQVGNAVDQNQWGSQLNANWDSLDSLLLTASNLITTTISTNTTLTNINQNQLIEVNAASGAVVVTLQASAIAGNGFRLVIKKTDSSANAVTVRANASENIDGANTYVLLNQNNSVGIVNDGTQWLIVVPVPTIAQTATSSTLGVVQPDNTTITISAGVLSAAKQSFTLGTPQSLTSGTTYTFTGIPSTAKQIIISFHQLAFSGTSIPWVQLGYSGGIISSGYKGSITFSGTGAGLSSAIPLATTNVTGPFDGQIILYLMDATNNIWSFSSLIGNSSDNFIASGSVALPGSLSQINITTAAGTATFSSGEMNISYQ